MSAASGMPRPDRAAHDPSLPHEAHLAAIAALEGIGPARLRWLLSVGPPDEVWRRLLLGRLPEAPRSLGLDRRALTSEAVRLGADAPARMWRRCESLGVGVVSLGSPGYPPALADDIDPPVVLFHRGDPDAVDGPRVGIVGTRRSTGYGLRIAEGLGRELSGLGVSIVSGLALGIDAAAHRGAIGASAAPPVGVVGGGLDVPCPARNRALAEQVVAEGVLLSEVPPGVPAAPWRFPVRNRVIAALSDAVVVVESAGAGGSMHTVREAMSRDRPVLAVPGPIDSRVSDGPNQLLRDGAHPCLDVDDVLGVLGHAVVAESPTSGTAPPPERRPLPGGPAAAVLDQLGWRPVSAEFLAGRCGLDFTGLSAALGELERDGWVSRSGSWIERVARPEDIPDERPDGA